MLNVNHAFGIYRISNIGLMDKLCAILSASCRATF